MNMIFLTSWAWEEKGVEDDEDDRILTESPSKIMETVKILGQLNL